MIFATRLLRRGTAGAAVLLAAGLAGGLAAPPAPASAATGPVQVTLPFTGLDETQGIAVDSAGNVYSINDEGGPEGSGQVAELPALPGGGYGAQVALPFTGLDVPSMAAVDPAGDVFLTNYGDNQVLELPALPGGGYGTQVTLPFTGVDFPVGIALDAAGDVFVTDYGQNQVLELPALPGGGYGAQVKLPFSGLDAPAGLALDAAGDVFVANLDSGQVFELPALPGGGYGPQVTLPFTGLGAPFGLALDPAGSVYVADLENNDVTELPALPGGGYGPQVTLPFTGVDLPGGLALDAAGDVYVQNGGANQVDELSQYVPSGTSITSASPSSPVAGQAFTVAVAVAAEPDGTGTFTGVPGGQVSVSDGAGQSCTASLSAGTGSQAGEGVGSCELTEATAGSYTLTASYAGQGAFGGSASAGTSLTVASPKPAATAPAFTAGSPPLTGATGTPYGYAFAASGTPAPSFSLTGAPAWLSVNSSTGQVAGTPPAGTKSFSYAVTASNSAGSVSAGPFTVAVTSNADVAVALSCPATLTKGSTGTCTLTVTNNGPAAATQVLAGAVVAPPLTVTSISPKGTNLAGLVTWSSLGTIAAGQSAVFTITVKAGAAGTAIVAAAAGAASPDPKLGNNLASATVTVTR